MYNLYDGNSGRYIRIEDDSADTAVPLTPPHNRQSTAYGNAPRLPSFMNKLMGMLPRTLGELENEDILLLLILYLLYKESGDEELLMIMGGMFLL